MLQNTLQQLQDSLALNRKLEAENQALRSAASDQERVLTEIAALYPSASDASIGTGSHWKRSVQGVQDALLVNVTVKKALSKDEQKRLQAWLETRLPDRSINLQLTVKR